MTGPRVTEHTYVGPAFANAKVYDAMHVGVVTCRPDTSLADAARMMAGYRIHCLIVADPESGQHAGSWSAIDALDVARAEAEGRVDTVGQIASADVVTIDSNTPLTEAARLMADRRTSHLVAVQPGTDRPVGVISTSGLAAVLAWGG